MRPRRVIVVGASLGAVSVVERLREREFDGEVVVVGSEPHLPYDRPPLSKRFLDGSLPGGSETLLLKPSSWYREHQVELRLGCRATALTADPLSVRLADGELLSADEIVIATGARARRIPGWPALRGIQTLRSLDDSQELHRQLRHRAGHLVILGAGFIGLEVAATAATMGWSVRVVEQAGAPLTRVLPRAAASLCLRGHYDRGVRIDCGISIDNPAGSRRVDGLRLRDGSTIPADLVVVGIGAVPNVDWLRGSGVRVDNGVVCDRFGRTSLSHVWAVGDVARWPNKVTGQHVRVEQWQAARDHGPVVADGILDGTSTSASWQTPPYFWSDLFDTKVQFAGLARPDMRTHVARSGRRALAVLGDDQTRGILAISNPRGLAIGRRLLLRNAPFKDAVAWADETLAGQAAQGEASLAPTSASPALTPKWRAPRVCL